MLRTIYLDGKYLKVSEQLLDAFTPGPFRAHGVFETMLGLDGVVLDVAEHLKRLRQGLKILRIKAPAVSPQVLKEVLQRNKLVSARLRLMVWQTGKHRHVMAMALPYQIPDGRISRACLVRSGRAAHSRTANVKSLDYGLFSRAYAQAHRHGFDEALLLNKRGHIFEASRANIFWVRDRVLYTPPLSSGCLNGITRAQVIRQVRRLKIPFKEKVLTPQVLKNADAVFLTNSLAGIKPIEVIFDYVTIAA